MFCNLSAAIPAFINENEINKIQYYNNLFTTLKKWGCVNFKYKFHNDLIEKPNKRVDIDYNNVNLNYYTEYICM